MPPMRRGAQALPRLPPRIDIQEAAVAPAALCAPISEGSAGTAQLSAAVVASHPYISPVSGHVGGSSLWSRR